MDTKAQMKMFHYYCQIQVYMYPFIYVDPQTMEEEDNFPDTKTFFVKYNKISTSVRFLKIGLDLVTYYQNIMSYI